MTPDLKRVLHLLGCASDVLQWAMTVEGEQRAKLVGIARQSIDLANEALDEGTPT